MGNYAASKTEYVYRNAGEAMTAAHAFVRGKDGLEISVHPSANEPGYYVKYRAANSRASWLYVAPLNETVYRVSCFGETGNHLSVREYNTHDALARAVFERLATMNLNESVTILKHNKR